MKRIFQTIVGLFAALALGSFVGCASVGHKTGQYVDDAAVTAKVKTAIFEDKNLKARDINVETHEGIVQLSGFVDSAAEAEHAVTVTRRIEGVRAVTNDMRLK